MATRQRAEDAGATFVVEAHPKNSGRVSRKIIPDPGLGLTSTWNRSQQGLKPFVVGSQRGPEGPLFPPYARP
jgi:hypothetical protein